MDANLLLANAEYRELKNIANAQAKRIAALVALNEQKDAEIARLTNALELAGASEAAKDPEGAAFLAERRIAELEAEVARLQRIGASAAAVMEDNDEELKRLRRKTAMEFEDVVDWVTCTECENEFQVIPPRDVIRALAAAENEAERLRHEVAHPFDAEEVLGAYERGARDALRWEQLSVRGGNPAHKSAADVAGDTVLARFLASRGTTENKGEEG